jgi:hypothetical protein
MMTLSSPACVYAWQYEDSVKRKMFLRIMYLLTRQLCCGMPRVIRSWDRQLPGGLASSDGGGFEPVTLVKHLEQPLPATLVKPPTNPYLQPLGADAKVV